MATKNTTIAEKIENAATATFGTEPPKKKATNKKTKQAAKKPTSRKTLKKVKPARKAIKKSKRNRV